MRPERAPKTCLLCDAVSNPTVDSRFVFSTAQAFATAPQNSTAVVEAAVTTGGNASRAVELALALGLSSGSQRADIGLILSSVIADKGCGFLRPTLLKVSLSDCLCPHNWTTGFQ